MPGRVVRRLEWLGCWFGRSRMHQRCAKGRASASSVRRGHWVCRGEFGILLQAVGVAGGDEAAEERMRLKRLGLELGVELAAEEEGVIGQLDDFDVGGVRRGAGDAQSACGLRTWLDAANLFAGGSNGTVRLDETGATRLTARLHPSWIHCSIMWLSSRVIPVREPLTSNL